MTAFPLPDGLQEQPALAAVPGGALALWTDARDGVPRIYRALLPSAPVPAGGAEPLTAAGTYEGGAALAVRDAVAIAAWERHDAGGGLHVYAARFDPAGTGPVSELPLGDGVRAARRPAVALGPHGGMIVWEEERPGGSVVLAAPWPAGAVAPGSPVAVSSAAGGSMHHARVVASAGGFLAVWSERPPAGATRVHAVALDASGLATGSSAVVSAADVSADNPDAARSGDAIAIVWNEFTPGGLRVAARLLDANGAPLAPPVLLLDAQDAIAHTPRIAGESEGFSVVAIEQGGAGRRLVRLLMEAGTSLAVQAVDPLTGWTEYAADPAVARSGAMGFAAWRRPLAGDDDDLYVGRWSHAAPHEPATTTPLVLAAGATGVGPDTERFRATARPNPGRPPFVIRREGGPIAGHAVLRIHDLAGRIVRSISIPDNAVEARWDGAGEDGRPVTPGVYFARGDGVPGLRIVVLP